MKNVVFLQENSCFNEIDVFRRMQKEYEKIFKKTCQNAARNIYKFIQKSASEKECNNDAKMFENGCPRQSRNQQNAVKIKVQKTT